MSVLTPPSRYVPLARSAIASDADDAYLSDSHCGTPGNGPVEDVSENSACYNCTPKYILPAHSVPLVTDADFELQNLNSTLFPGIASSIMVHSGFADEHAKWVRHIR